MAIYDEAACVLGCVETHTEKRYGRWTRGSRDEYGLLIKSDGRPSHRMRCRACGVMSSDVPLNQVRGWGIQDVAFVEIREAGTYDPCVVLGCTNQGRELHHFAPRNTFGERADSWPTASLCQEHHREWHQMMDGYRWHRRAAAA